jgi:hypothetical protein
MTLEEAFGMKLHYVRGMVDGMAKRLETESWQFLLLTTIPEYLETTKHELTTLVDMWADIKAKRESEVDKAG